MSRFVFRHAGGPWSLVERTKVVAPSRPGHPPTLVADLSPALVDAFNVRDWDQAEANARLIVESPAMAAMLDRVLDRLSDGPLSHVDRRRLVHEIAATLRRVAVPIDAARSCA